jgi:hypothetical protein
MSYLSPLSSPSLFTAVNSSSRLPAHLTSVAVSAPVRKAFFYKSFLYISALVHKESSN